MDNLRANATQFHVISGQDISCRKHTLMKSSDHWSPKFQTWQMQPKFWKHISCYSSVITGMELGDFCITMPSVRLCYIPYILYVIKKIVRFSYPLKIPHFCFIFFPLNEYMTWCSIEFLAHFSSICVQYFDMNWTIRYGSIAEVCICVLRF